MKYFVLLLVYLVFVTHVFAYTLPYPSYMPGHKFYQVSRLLDSLKSRWYWGDIAGINYTLGLADKYLVEAKTLFEYKQYLLAVDALKRSNEKVQLLPKYLQKAYSHGKDVRELQNKTAEAMNAHIIVLHDLADELPKEFMWQPEKASATYIPIATLLDEAKQERLQLQNFHAQ